ncbi:MAG TPA: hypothetical protein VLK33_16555 [Terriglobales bacterium]|nr:hypothetical protein [Terriglobales bacterium]
MRIKESAMEARRKAVSDMNFGAGKYFTTLARSMFAPQDEIQEEVEAARERIKQVGAANWPPQTEDENLVSAYDAMTTGTPKN